MEQPNPYLDGESPIELAETVEGANRVLEYIRNWIAQSTQPSAPDAGVSSAIDECLLLADGCPLWRAAIGQKWTVDTAMAKWAASLMLFQL